MRRTFAPQVCVGEGQALAQGDAPLPGLGFRPALVLRFLAESPLEERERSLGLKVSEMHRGELQPALLRLSPIGVAVEPFEGAGQEG